MIQANELRIGNLLLYNGKIDKVTAIDLDLDDENVPLVSFSDSNPVELNFGKVQLIHITPEILEKIFIPNRLKDFLKINICRLYYRQNDPGDFLEFDVKYLHQLQNLYFALTGEELPVTL